MWQYIDCAERESAHVCEVCGKPGSLHSAKRGFWVKTLCTDCAKDRYIPYDRNEMV
jgi:ribosomal protein L37AE/L43A